MFPYTFVCRFCLFLCIYFCFSVYFFGSFVLYVVMQEKSPHTGNVVLDMRLILSLYHFEGNVSLLEKRDEIIR